MANARRNRNSSNSADTGTVDTADSTIVADGSTDDASVGTWDAESGSGAIEADDAANGNDGGDSGNDGSVSADASEQGDGNGGSGSDDSGSGSNGSASGSGDTSGRVGGNRHQPGKRYRYSDNCDCEQCTERRSQGVQSEASTIRVSGTPREARGQKPVQYEALAAKREKLSGNIQQEFISMGVDAIFTAPTLVLPAGTADHWPLEQAESKELVKRLEAVIAMLPKKRKTAAERILAKWGPPLLLLGTAGLITVPRVLLTRELLAQRKQQRPQPPQPSPTMATSANTIYPAEPTANGNGNGIQADNVTASGNGDLHRSAQGNARTGFSALNAEVTDFKAL